MFSDPDYFIENIVIFQWAMHIGSVLKKVLPQNFQKHQLENKSLNLKVITYESESYGAFTKTTLTQHNRKHHLNVSCTQHNQVVAGTAWCHTQSLWVLSQLSDQLWQLVKLSKKVNRVFRMQYPAQKISESSSKEKKRHNPAQKQIFFFWTRIQNCERHNPAQKCL